MFPKSLAGTLVCYAAAVYGQSIDLGTAGLYAVVGAATITNTGLTVVDGSLAVFPGTSTTGFPPGVFTGIESDGDVVAGNVQNDASHAFQQATGLSCGTDLTGTNLGGQVLLPGVYCFSSSATLAGILTLDGQGDANAVFVFQVGSTLTTAVASQVLLINSAQPCAVFWALGSSATLGLGTNFIGNILASNSISVEAAVSSLGGLYALTGVVSLIDNQITAVGPCGSLSPSASAPGTTSTTSTTSSSSTSSTSSTSSSFSTSTVAVTTSASSSSSSSSSSSTTSSTTSSPPTTFTTTASADTTTTTPASKSSTSNTLKSSMTRCPRTCRDQCMPPPITTTKTTTKTETPDAVTVTVTHTSTSTKTEKANTVTTTKTTTSTTTKTSTSTATATKTLTKC